MFHVYVTVKSPSSWKYHSAYRSQRSAIKGASMLARRDHVATKVVDNGHGLREVWNSRDRKRGYDLRKE